MDCRADVSTRRSLYTHLPNPNSRDNINNLSCRDQCIIIRLHIGHSTLNKRLHGDHRSHPMLQRTRRRNCKHHLLNCSALKGHQKYLLPQKSTHRNSEQIKQNCRVLPGGRQKKKTNKPGDQRSQSQKKKSILRICDSAQGNRGGKKKIINWTFYCNHQKKKQTYVRISC